MPKVDGRLDRRRLALVAARFESPHDGERIAALEAAGRLLAAAGVSWRELIDGAAEARDDEGEPVGAPHHHQIVAELLAHAAALLTPWEHGFLRGLRGFTTLSEKQRASLAEIQRKAELAHGADA